MSRSSGVLLHPTSLPGPGLIGTLGPSAFRFVDTLHAAGQTWWQVLPLGPTGYGDSPYQTLSAFAGNPMLLSREALVEDDLFVAPEGATAAAAATVILDGVKAERWRILVGQDAHHLDELVRQAPEDAYDDAFFERFAAENGWRVGR